MIDAILMGCFLAALYFNRGIYPAVISYAMCCFYMVTLFDSHSAVINHVIYGLIFIPACFAANIRLATGMLCYSTFHLVVALDYFIYPDVTTPISYLYHYMQISLALSLIYIGFGVSNDSTDDVRNRHDFVSRLGYIWNFQAHSKTQEKAQ